MDNLLAIAAVALITGGALYAVPDKAIEIATIAVSGLIGFLGGSRRRKKEKQ